MYKIMSAGTANGYKMVRVFGHGILPNGTRIYEHRLVMTDYLKRRLKPGEVVHHKNEDKKDNILANLQLMKAGSHVSKHLHDWYEKSSRLKKAIRSINISKSKSGRPQPWAKGPKGAIRSDEFKKLVSGGMKRYCKKLPPGEMARRSACRAKRTACKNGHALSAENTFCGDGRRCKICHADYKREKRRQ